MGPRISEPLLSECLVYPKKNKKMSWLCNISRDSPHAFQITLTAVKMAASMCRQRKRAVLSLQNKLSILDRLAKGEKLIVNLVLATLQ